MTLRKASAVSHSDRASQELPLACWQVTLKPGRTLRYADSGRISEKRVRSLTDKEPTTTAWIDSFAAAEVLYDVGANVGTYSVYAGVLADCPVYAFEPEALNYAELNKNLHLNGLRRSCLAYNLALSDRCGPDVLYLSRFGPGHSHHDAGERRWEGPVTGMVASAADRPRQGCLLTTLDALVYGHGLPVPAHVKVDVDGLEHRVVAGAERLLGDPGLRTFLVETNYRLPGSVALLDELPRRGWRYSIDQVTVAKNYKTTEGQWRADVAAGRGGCNVIYYKDPFYDDYFRRFKAQYLT